MGSNKPLILLDDSLQAVDTTQTINIMLPPQLYTLKRQDLQVKYLYQAKKLAPSVLDNLLEEDKNYDYYVYKEEDDWIFIAYDPEEIVLFLKSKNIAVEQISKLYFAQQVIEKFSTPVLLNRDEVLSRVQETVVVIPRELLPLETEFQLFDSSFAPASGISFGANIDSMIGKKDTWILGVIFFLFAVMFMAEGVRYKGVVTMMHDEVSLLLEDYPALQSQYARENIAAKYRKIDKEERHKREVLKDISRLVLPGVELNSLLMDSKHISVTFKSPDKKTVTRIQSIAKKKKYKASRIGSENIIKIEILL